MENKVVSEKTVYVASLEINRSSRVVVNPNGRGYEADNVTRHLDHDILNTTLRADTPAKLAEKIQAVMATIEEDA